MSLGENELEKEYIRRINLALNFIDNHLDSELSLEKIAQAAFYSPFHFHRIFKAIIGETLHAYIVRQRIEKMASVLMHGKEINITSLSLQYGFSSNSSFTKAFKKYYGLSPSQFRNQIPDRHSKIQKVKSKNGQERLIFEKYICNSNDHLSWIKMNAKIEIKELPDQHFACITHHGINGIEAVFKRLIKWKKSNSSFENWDTIVARVFHDNFNIWR